MYKTIAWISPFLFASLLSFDAGAIEQIQGVGIHANKYSKSADDVLELINKTGFSSFRQDMTWNDIESKKGSYAIPNKLQINDYLINKSQQYKIIPLVILDYGNKNYNNGGYPVSDEDITAFANYARWIATRYKGKVPYYEIWNEWTVGTGMKGKGNIPSADTYLKLVKETSAAIRQVDPQAKILAGSVNPISPNGRRLAISDTEWFNQLLDKGILDYIDGISIHPYSFMNANKKLRNPEDNIQKIDNFYKNILNKNSKSIPIYITEIGVPTHDGLGGVSQAEAADFIVKYTILAKTKKYIKGIWWYDLRDDGNDPDNQEHNFGFYGNEFDPKQAALAFINMHKVLMSMELNTVAIQENNNAREVVVSMKNPINNKMYEINWNERQLIQNGRLKILNSKSDDALSSIDYDQKKLSSDVSVK